MADKTDLPAEILSAPPPAYAGTLEGAAVEAIAALAREASKPELILIPTDGLEPGLPPRVPVLFDRHTQSVLPVLKHLEDARPKMVRKGAATVTTLASFVDLVNRHKDEGSAIFAKTDWPGPRLTAVIDYHDTAKTARWGKHRIVYNFPITKEFETWVAKNGEAMDQADFAEFIEEHAAELAAPDVHEINEFEPRWKERFATPAELIDLSRHLEVNVGSTVKNASRLASGERQVVFETQHTNAAGEPVDIPGIFMVSVAPFLSGDREPEVVRIPARIRYRVANGKITWNYQLYRWEYFLRERIQEDLAFAAKQTALPAYEGAPEMAD